MFLQLALCLALASGVLCASPAEWSTRSIYQVLTDRFALSSPPSSSSCDLHNYCGGTWQGIESHLDYIQGLGFDSVWVSPVVDNAPGGYHGYWQRRMYESNSNMGAWADLLSLSTALHARGMLLMVDIVANHASTNDISQNSPFNSTSSYHDCSGCPSGCSVDNYEDHTQMEHCRLAGLQDFDQTEVSGPVATELLQWVSFVVNASGADGLRVDTVPYVFPPFWRRFEAAAGVYAVGEVDTGDLAFASPYQGSALSGILSYPLFFTLRTVFGQQGSMRALGAQWRAGLAAWANVSLLGVFADNHDNARFLSQQSDVGLYRAALAYSMLSDGIPIVYYGSEWLFRGGNDPECREAFWEAGGSYSAQQAPLGPFLAALNSHRREAALWASAQLERWQDDSFYAFTKGDSTLAAFTNVGSNGGVQSRAVTYLPAAWPVGTVVCDLLDCKSCATVAAGPVLQVQVKGSAGVAVYSPSVAQC